MTVATETSRTSYTGDAVTDSFSTGFYFLDEADLAVKYTPDGGVEVVWTLGVDYTVTMPASVGAAGSIQCTTPPAADSSLVIERDVDFVQATSFRSQGTFSPAIHENALDRATFMAQELQRRVSDLESAGAAGSVVAGSGLTSSGVDPMTIHVGAGTGIQVNANDVQFKAADAAGAGLTSDGASELSVATGDGLTTAGGNLAVSFAATTEDINGAAGAVGTDVVAARQDHTHKVQTAAPVDIGSANAAGTGPTLAMSDHVHDHGQQTDGTFHAVATGATAGFMSAADKTAHDALVATRSKVQCTTAGLGQALPVATTLLLNQPEVFDLLGEFNPLTGLFTAGVTGYYFVGFLVETQGAALTAGDQMQAFIKKNAASTVYGTTFTAQTGATLRTSSGGCGLVSMTAGDTLSLYAVVSGATALTCDVCHLTILRVL